jgi:DNA mismatch repair ATPase MutL
MKRKIITAILAITVVFSAASCGTAGSKSSNIQSDTQEATVSDTQNSTERTTETAGDTQSEETAATVKDDEKVSGSGTSKSDTSDTTASSSADSTVKKNSSDSKSSAKNSTSTAVKHNSTQSTGASNAGTKTNKAADSNTAASNTTSQGKSECTHKWVKYVANTIQHKEEGHYETKVVKAAYDEPQYDYHYVCLKCGEDLGTDDTTDLLDHGDVCDGNYTSKLVQVGSIHHDAVTEQVYVVDQAAYTENVYGEKCSVCGATK